jgi:IS30 family transposase
MSLTNILVRSHNNNNKKKKKKKKKKGIRQIKDIIAEKTKERWQGKMFYRKFPRNVDEKMVGNEQSYRWVNFGDIK